MPELFDTVPVLDLSTLEQIAQRMCLSLLLGLIADEKVELRVICQVPIYSTLLKTLKKGVC